MNGGTEAKRSIPYDELAAHYPSVSAARAAYLRAVKEIIIRKIAGNADSLLDVGSADGGRCASHSQRTYLMWF